jgi:hypothetical protein
MFCPNCGLDDPNKNQFCRGCGTLLQVVRSVLEQPDTITSSAVTAREGIGRAIADKIAEFEDAHELRQSVHELLPAIQRFLESPEERLLYKQEQRLNQIREGVLTSVVGLAIVIPSLLLSWMVHEERILIASALGLLVFLIGLGITITAWWFTGISNASGLSSENINIQIERGEEQKKLLERKVSNPNSGFQSVTEVTTRQL